MVEKGNNRKSQRGYWSVYGKPEFMLQYEKFNKLQYLYECFHCLFKGTCYYGCMWKLYAHWIPSLMLLFLLYYFFNFSVLLHFLSTVA